MLKVKKMVSSKAARYRGESAGNVYVADDGNRRVQEFNSKGEFVRAFGSEGTGEGKFEYLPGVAVDGEGHVWAIERGIR